MQPNDEQLSVLQNLEFSVVQVCRKHPEMTDYHALRAYEAAFKIYRAEQRGQKPTPPVLTGLDLTTFEAVKAMCEYRLGRQSGPESTPNPASEPVAPALMELLLWCLRELTRSVERHTKHDGHRGYLAFIQQFIQ